MKEIPAGVRTPLIRCCGMEPIAPRNGDLWFSAVEGKFKKRQADATTDLDTQGATGGGEAFPVGSVFISVVATNPATLLGYGTWAAFGAGRVMVGLDAADAAFDTVEETGGSKTHTLSVAEMPAHTHVQNAHTHQFLPRSATTGSVSSIVTGTLDTSSTISGANQPHVQAATAVNQDTGGGGAHNNLQPYIVVRMWKRTA